MSPANTLRSVPLFSQLRESDLEQLARLAQPKEFPKNRVVLHANDPCDAFYIVLKGTIKMMLIAEDGREVILSLMRKGDFFGEMALMDDEPYAASAIAMEDANLLVLPRDDFRRSLIEMPGMALGLMRALCGRLAEADHKIGGLILVDVAGRVAHLFLELAAQHGGDVVPNPPTHAVIAQLVGSSRETVSRTVSAMQQVKTIENSAAGMRILNREALENAAGQLLRRQLRVRRERGEPAGAELVGAQSAHL